MTTTAAQSARTDAPAGAVRTESRLTALMLVLTFSTGIVDAASYLGLHHVFTANMTGNVIFLGLGLTGHNGIPVLRSALALLGFLAGAAAAGHYQRFDRGQGRVRLRVVVSLGGVATLLLALTVIVGIWRTPSTPALNAITVAFGLAMGAQAAAARALAVVDVSTVVVTSTMAAFMAEPWFGAGRSPRTARRLLAGLGIAAGALIGAFLVRIDLWVPMLIAALLATGVCIGVGAARRSQPGDQPRVHAPGSEAPKRVHP